MIKYMMYKFAFCVLMYKTIFEHELALRLCNFIIQDAKVIISQILFGWHKKFKKREVQHSKENACTKQFKKIHPRKMIIIR